MNFANGKIIDTAQAEEVLNNLNTFIAQTLAKPPISLDKVIEACNRFSLNMDEAKYCAILEEMDVPAETALMHIQEAKLMFSAAYLRQRVKCELGGRPLSAKQQVAGFGGNTVTEAVLPLGVLLHIPAGNADGLPVYSVLEGLLSGNINILKLPAVDGGLSVMILKELVAAQPELAEYIYVFDYSSRDASSISKLIDAANAVVVWGGDAAVKALRGLVPPNIKLIEWGHKSSFAYTTKAGMNDQALQGLAEHICQTNQLLCTSCQGIFVDTNNMDEVYDFCKIFLPFLQQAGKKSRQILNIAHQTKVTLQLYTQQIEAISNGSTVFKGEGCSLTAIPNSCLEPAIQFANCWVKPLPKNQIIPTLWPYKNHLQTVGLLCSTNQQEEYAALLVRAGVVRVTNGHNMSQTYCGAAHDGEYPLQRYTKVVSLEI